MYHQAKIVSQKHKSFDLWQVIILKSSARSAGYVDVAIQIFFKVFFLVICIYCDSEDKVEMLKLAKNRS